MYCCTLLLLRLLERLLESNVLHYCKDLSLDMYNFYHRQATELCTTQDNIILPRPDVVQTWTFDVEPEFELER